MTTRRTPDGRREDLVADAEPANAPRHLRIVRGDATPEEVAAIVAVLSARAATTGVAAPRPRSNWAAPRLSLRRESVGGPDAWHRSGFTSGIRTRADW
jgi:hypothetical protein